MSLLARWKLNETSGLTAYDSVASYNASLVNFSGDEWSTDHARGSGSLNFSAAAQDYCRVISYPAGAGVGNFSVSFWVKTTQDSTGSQKFFISRGTWTTGSWIFAVADNIQVSFKCEGENQHAETVFGINDGAWHHIVGTLSADAPRIYIDGIFRDAGERGLFSEASREIRFGMLDGFSDYFDGKLDDIRYYDHALTPVEVLDLYCSPNNLTPEPALMVGIGSLARHLYSVDGGEDVNWSSPGNWSRTSGGTGGSDIPTAIDSVTFDDSSPDITLDCIGNCYSLRLSAVYEHILDPAGYDMNIGAGGLTVLRGTIEPSSGGGVITIAGPTVIGGGVNAAIVYKGQNQWVSSGGFSIASNGVFDTDSTGAINITGNLSISDGGSFIESSDPTIITVSGEYQMSGAASSHTCGNAYITINGSLSVAAGLVTQSGGTWTVKGSVSIAAGCWVGSQSNFFIMQPGAGVTAAYSCTDDIGMFTVFGDVWSSSFVSLGTALTAENIIIKRGALYNYSNNITLVASFPGGGNLSVGDNNEYGAKLIYSGNSSVFLNVTGNFDIYGNFIVTGTNPVIGCCGNLTVQPSGSITPSNEKWIFYDATDPEIRFNSQTIYDLYMNPGFASHILGNVKIDGTFTIQVDAGEVPNTAYFAGGITVEADKIVWTGVDEVGDLFLLREPGTLGQWKLKCNDIANSVLYAQAEWSNASSGYTIDATDPSNTDLGYNSNWDFGINKNCFGDFVPEPALMTGEGGNVSELVGYGDLVPQPAVINGVGDNVSIIVGVGELSATPSSIAGAGNSIIFATGTGDLFAKPGSIAGIGTKCVIGTGELSAELSSISGTGLSTIFAVGTGSMSDEPGSIDGVGSDVSFLIGAGSLSIGTEPSINGVALDSHPGFGDLTAPPLEVEFPSYGWDTKIGIGRLVSEAAIIDNQIAITGHGHLQAKPLVCSGFATATDVYECNYSVGTSTSDLKTGSPNITVSLGIMTFDIAQSGNIGVGDVVTYGSGSKLSLSEKISATQWSVTTLKGHFPVNVDTPAAVTSIKRAFNSLDAAVGCDTGTGVPYPTGIVGSGFIGTRDLYGWKASAIIWCYKDGEDTAPVYIAGSVSAGYITSFNYMIRILVPGPAVIDDNLWTGEDTMSNNIQHTTTGVAGDGYRLVVDDAAPNSYAIKIENVFAQVICLEIGGTCDNGILIYCDRDFEGAGYGVLNPRIRDCIINNTGSYGLHVDSDVGLGIPAYDNLSSWNNIIYGQSIANIFFENGAEKSYVYDNTLDHGDGACVGILHAGSAMNGRCYMEFDVFVGTAANDVSFSTPSDAYPNYCFGKQSVFSPLIRRSNYIITESYDDVFVDRDTNDYNLTSESPLFLAGINDVSTTYYNDEVFPYDLVGTKRGFPKISIGALEHALKFELIGNSIGAIWQEKLNYIAYPVSPYLYGALESEETKGLFLRPAGFIQVEALKEQFARESKILMEIKDPAFDSSVSNLRPTFVASFTAYYDVDRMTLIFNKPSNYSLGLFLKMIGDKQYLFTYDEQNQDFSVWMFAARELVPSGTKSIINNVMAGG